MKKKYTSLLICTITLLFLIQFFIYTKEITNAFFDGTILFIKNLLPNIFLFFIISDILNNYNIINYLSLIFGNIFSKLFKVSKEGTYVFFMSMLSGFPGNSKFIKELLDNNRINEQDATKLLTFTHFSNPLFIISTIGINFLHDKKIGFIILISHFITNIIIGLLFRNIYKCENKILLKKESISLPFIPLLKNSISNTFNGLMVIYGIIIFFFILTTIININLKLDYFHQTLLNGFIEMTNGLNMIKNLNFSIDIKASLMAFFISFGGFSVHMQVMSMLSNYKINYFIYFIARLLHASISALLVFFRMIYH